MLTISRTSGATMNNSTAEPQTASAKLNNESLSVRITRIHQQSETTSSRQWGVKAPRILSYGTYLLGKVGYSVADALQNGLIVSGTLAN